MMAGVTISMPGETEAGSAGMHPCRGITWWAHRDDDRERGTHLPRPSQNHIGLKDPDALKIPARRAEYSLMENALSPFHAEPAHYDQGRDLAFIMLDSPPNHPCCVLEDGYPTTDEELVAFGYTELYPQGESGGYKCDGISNDKDIGQLLKVKAGQASPGMSGGPLVSLTTGKVCAVMATERLNTAMGGARALPIETAYRIWPDLKTCQQANEDCRKQWLKTLPSAERGDLGFEYDIPTDWTLWQVVEAMMQITGGVSKFEGFRDQELNAPVKSRSVSAKSLSEAIVQLRLITVAADAVRSYAAYSGPGIGDTMPGSGLFRVS
jgi:hypothetical protein